MKRYFFFSLIILVLLVLFFYSARVEEDFYRIVQFLERLAGAHPFFAVLVFTGLAGASAMLSPFSSIPLVPPAILIWGTEITFLLLLLGWLLGATVTYLIGYYGVNPILRRFLNSEERFKYYKERIPRRAEFWLVLLFRLALPTEIPGYVLGSLRYHFGWYFLATFMSEVVFAAMTIYGSEAIVHHRGDVLLAYGIVLIGLFATTFELFVRTLKKHKTTNGTHQ